MDALLPGDKFAPAGYLRPVAGGNGRMERMKPPKRTKDGKIVAASEIKFHGEVEIRQRGVPGICNVRVPDPTWWNPWRTKACGCGELHQVARNKIVSLGLKHIFNHSFMGFSAGNGGGGGATYPFMFETNVQSRSSMRLGLGTAATTEGMTGLTGQIATVPNSTAVTQDNPSAGVFRDKFTAVWNAGALAVNTITEIGIFGFLTAGFPQTPAGNDAGGGLSGSFQLFARLTSTDGEFTAFTINPAVPLTVEYRVVLTFT